MSYIVRVQLINEDQNVMFSDFEDPYMAEAKSPGEIFRMARDEFGRCQSKIFLDFKDGSVKHVGWYFVKRNHYDRGPEDGMYLQGAWVTVYEETPRQLESVDLGGRP